jgi:hypothetical protein
VTIDCSVIRYWLAASAVLELRTVSTPRGAGVYRKYEPPGIRHSKPQADNAATSFSSRRWYLPAPLGDRIVVQGRDRRLLDGDELARIAVVLDVGKRLHDPLVAADPADPPADHVEALGQRVDLDAHLRAPGTDRKLSGSPEKVSRMWAASCTTTICWPSELDHLLVELPRGHACRWGCWDSSAPAAWPACRIGGDAVQVGQKSFSANSGRR